MTRNILCIELEINGALADLPQIDKQPDYSDEFDDCRSVLSDICESLQATERVKFKVGGFGQSDWPVSVSMDLPTILEQIPATIQLISDNKYPCELSFYEQGIERTITFDKKDFAIEASCTTWTNWIPSPQSVLIDEKYILSQLINLKLSFLQVAKVVCPQMAESNLFINWCES